MSPAHEYLKPLRTAVRSAVIACAAGSLGFMGYLGRRNSSVLLMLMFTVWVLSPFALFLWAAATPRRGSDSAVAALYYVMAALALGAVIIYGVVAFGTPRAQPAAMFLIVPPASMFVFAIAIRIAAVTSRSQ